MRPNKTNFGLSFGHFGGSYVKGEEEEEAKKGMELYGTCMELGICMEMYGNYVLWIYDFEYGCYDVFVWILVVPFLGFS